MIKLGGFFVFALLIIFAGEVFAAMQVEIPASVRQGGVVRVTIKNDLNVTYYISYDMTEHSALRIGTKTYLALIPIPVYEIPRQIKVCGYYFGPNREVICGQTEILKTDFPEAKGIGFVGDLKGKLLGRFEKEKAELERVFALRTPERFWKEDLKFSAPLKEMVVTSPFGQIRHKRSNKYGKWDTNHFGVDLKAFVGTPVLAVEGGIVRISRNWLAEGGIVIIDHGYGLESLYFHLSRLKAKEGQRVKVGDVIALSGQTGAAQGPHLHFEVRKDGIAVSPWNFMPEAGDYK